MRICVTNLLILVALLFGRSQALVKQHHYCGKTCNHKDFLPSVSLLTMERSRGCVAMAMQTTQPGAPDWPLAQSRGVYILQTDRQVAAMTKCCGESGSKPCASKKPPKMPTHKQKMKDRNKMSVQHRQRFDPNTMDKLKKWAKSTAKIYASKGRAVPAEIRKLLGKGDK